ncbi:MAG: class I SAM-dependent methyltransferase [Spirochaetota bacterium]
MNPDNTTSHISSRYDAEVENTIPYYAAMHEETLRFVKAYNARPRAWLDTGCGTGNLALGITERFAPDELVLADPSADMLDIARAKMAGANVRFVQAETCALELPDDHFDVITAIQSHHYYSAPERAGATARCFRLLKKGGPVHHLRKHAPELRGRHRHRQGVLEALPGGARQNGGAGGRPPGQVRYEVLPHHGRRAPGALQGHRLRGGGLFLEVVHPGGVLLREVATRRDLHRVFSHNRAFQLIPPAPFSSGKRRGSSGIRLSGDIRNPAYGSWRLAEFIPEAVLRRHMDDDTIPPLFRSKRGGQGVS